MFIAKSIKYIAVAATFLFPFIVIKSWAFPLVFPHVMFMFFVIETLVLIFLLYGLYKKEITVKKSYLTLGLLIYIVVMFVAGIAGSEFQYSFWSNYSRMSGIVTWLHYVSFFIILSSVFTEERDWRSMFRALALSGFLLALVSFLGVDGIGAKVFDFLARGGSFLGNTSYSGAFFLLIFFFSLIGISIEQSKTWKVIYGISLLVIFFNPDLFNFSLWKGEVAFKEAFKNPTLFMGIARASSMVLWGGIVLSIGTWILGRLRNKKVVIMLASAFLVIMTVFYAYGFVSLMKGQGRLYEGYVAQSGIVRPMVWHMAVQGIKERPILGYGNGNFKYVYQKYLDPKMIHLEDPPWFDRVHNFTLEELIGNGLIGLTVMFGLFVTIIITSFRLYLENKRTYLLFIPFIFFLHFLQLQTFFQVDSTLLLSFILLAFLVSHQKNVALSIPYAGRYASWYSVGIILLYVASIIFFIAIPVRQNKLILSIPREKVRSERMELEKRLTKLSIDPVETLRRVNIWFSNETATHTKDLEKAGLLDEVGKEYSLYFAAYEKYLSRYEYSHRFLYEYANIINTAYMFGIDELEKGEELARQAIEISDAYPYAHLVLAINLYYQGKTAEALASAKRGYDIDPTLEKSQQVYQTLQTRARSSSTQSFMYLFLE